jgi:membrane protein implicated in regulation of membrane protease activity
LDLVRVLLCAAVVVVLITPQGVVLGVISTPQTGVVVATDFSLFLTVAPLLLLLLLRRRKERTRTMAQAQQQHREEGRRGRGREQWRLHL